MTACDLSIIIVSWNVRDLLRTCLLSIEQQLRPSTAALGAREFGPTGAGATCEVIVVDNASHDGTVALLEADFPWVRAVQSDVNLGFSAGNNLGFAASQGRFVYFLNPDTELLAGGVGDGLWLLYSIVAGDETIGAAGPQLRYGDGAVQPSARRFPSRGTAFFESTWLGRRFPRNPWARRLHMDDWRVDYPHDVDWLVGAALLARRTALDAIRLPDQLGPFDEDFFMYSEELDLCWRLKLDGWRVIYVPAAQVIHHEGRSSEQVVAARHIHFNTSRVRLYEKYFGSGWAEALRRYLLFEYREQLWQERIKRLMRSRPELRTARIDAYRQVLASQLLPRNRRTSR